MPSSAELAHSTPDRATDASTSPATTLPTSTVPAVGSNLVLIDTSVPDYQHLVDGVLPGSEVYLLNAQTDAMTQITQILQGRGNIQSLHIVSHGNMGGLAFASSDLNLANLPQYAAQLQSWHTALTADAAILLYGCDVAQGEQGQAFVRLLSQSAVSAAALITMAA